MMWKRSILSRAKRILLPLAALSCIGISPPGVASILEDYNCGAAYKQAPTMLKCEGNNILDTDTGLMWAGWSYFSGKVDYAGALAYIADLNRQKYGGYDDWRLPSAGLVGPGYGPDGCSNYNGSCNGGYNITRPEAELSYLWHKAGMRGYYNPDGSLGTGNFFSAQWFGLIGYKQGNYWLAEHILLPPYYAKKEYWRFHDERYNRGFQKPFPPSYLAYAWAVRTAFVPAVRPPLVAPERVPEPASFSLLAAALAVIVALRLAKRRKPFVGRLASA